MIPSLITCAVCGSPIPVEAKTCPQCRNPITPEVEFSASTTEIVAPHGVKLSWKVTGAPRVTIVPGGVQAPQGSIVVYPKTTQAYRLTATGSAGPLEREIVVNVLPEASVAPGTVPLSPSDSPNAAGQPGAQPQPSQEPTPVSTISPTPSPIASGWNRSWPPLLLLLLLGGLLAWWTLGRKLDIVEFSAEPPVVRRGGQAILRWKTRYAKQIRLDPGGKVVKANGELAVSPNQNQEYTLTIIGPNSRDSRKLQVSVTEFTRPPKIERFDANPHVKTIDQSAHPGDPVLLTWQASNAEEVILDPGGIAVASAGRREEKPAATTKYRLTAKSPLGEETREIEVIVAGLVQPKIERFMADPNTTTENQTVVLRWKVSGATSATISGLGTSPPLNRTVAAEGEFAVTVAHSTDFSIRAGTATSSVTVTVAQGPRNPRAAGSGSPGRGNVSPSSPNPGLPAAPVIDEFVADPPTIHAGGISTLRWRVTGAEQTQLDSSRVNASGQQAVQPKSRTTYVLVATNRGGTSRRSATVDMQTAQRRLEVSVLGLGQPVSTSGPTMVTRERAQLMIGYGDFAVKFEFSGYISPPQAVVSWKVDGTGVYREELALGGSSPMFSELKQVIDLAGPRTLEVFVDVDGQRELSTSFVVEPRVR